MEISYNDLKNLFNLKNDKHIAELFKRTFDLVNDGIKYRSDHDKESRAAISTMATTLSFAQDFIKSKGLADEFNKYCDSRSY